MFVKTLTRSCIERTYALAFASSIAISCGEVKETKSLRTPAGTVEQASGDSQKSPSSVKAIAPAQPLAGEVTQQNLTVQWPAQGDEKGFFVERALQTNGSCQTYTQIAQLSGDVHSYKDGGLAPGTSYCYRVRAIGRNGDFSEYSKAVVLTTSMAVPGRASLVSALEQGPTPSRRVTLSWRTVLSATTYAVERAPGACATGVFSVVAKASADDQTAVDGTVAAATTYCYRVFASNDGGAGLPSEGLMVTTSADGAPADAQPTVPSGLVSTSVSVTGVVLAWNPAVGASGYHLQRADAAAAVCGPFSDLNTIIGMNSANYTDGSVAPAHSYCYRLSAYNVAGSSDFSESIRANLPSVVKDAPNFTSTSSLTSSGVTLNWSGVGMAIRYGIERALSVDGVVCGAFTKLADVAVTNYSDAGLTPGRSFCYRVQAFDGTGVGTPYAGVAIVTTPPMATPVVPEAPTQLSVSNIQATSLLLSWTRGGVAAVGKFIVERAEVCGGNFQKIGEVSTTTTDSLAMTYQLTDKALIAGSPYCYRVAASNTVGTGPYGGAVSTRTSSAPTPPATPSALTATNVLSGSLALSWADQADEDGYRLERALATSSVCSGFAVLTAIGKDSVSFADKGLVAGKVYCYRLSAFNSVGYSAPGPVLQVSTAPLVLGAPTISSISNLTQKSVKLAWSAVADASSYDVERADIACMVFSKVASGSMTSLLDDTLSAATTYCYRVRAWAAEGVAGAYSATVKVSSLDVAPPVPQPPTFSLQTSTGVTVSWLNVGHGASYGVWRKDPGGSFRQITLTAAGATSFVDSGLRTNSDYAYSLTAKNSVGTSANSIIAVAHTLPPAPEAPMMQAVGAITTASAVINWKKGGLTTIDRFDLERAEAGSSGCSAFLKIGQLVPDATDPVTKMYTYTDASLASGKNFCFHILAVNSGGSQASTTLTLRTPSNVAPGSAPILRGLADAEIGVTSLTLNWSAVTAADNYLLQQASYASGACQAWATIATLPDTVTTKVVDGLVSNATYCFQVKGYSFGGAGPYSSPLIATTKLSAPNYSASPLPDNNDSISLTDNYSTSGAAFTDVFWGTDIAVSADSKVVRLPVGGHFTLTGLTPSTKYYFRARSVAGTTVSDLTSVLTVALGDKAVATLTPPPGTFTKPVSVTIAPKVNNVRPAYSRNIFLGMKSIAVKGSRSPAVGGFYRFSELEEKILTQVLTPKDLGRVRFNGLLGTAISTDGRTMLKSVDGGKTWSLVISDFELEDYIDNRGVADAVFTDKDHGYLLLNSVGFSVIFGTNDGGKSWAYKASTVGGAGAFSLLVKDDKTFAIMDVPSSANFYPSVKRTTDGGLTWVSTEFVTEPISASTSGVIDNDNAWFAVQKSGTSTSVIYWTTDGGATFRSISAPDSGRFLPLGKGTNEYALLNFSGKFYRGSGDPVVWRQPGSVAGMGYFAEQSLYLVANGSISNFVTVLSDGSISTSDNDGKDWYAQNSTAGTAVLKDVARTSAGALVGVGPIGSIATSTASAWNYVSKAPAAVATPLSRIRFFGSDDLLGVAFRPAQIFLTQDGGETWRQHDVGFDVKDVFVASTQTVWVAGSTALLRSDDAGATWAAIGSKVTSTGNKDFQSVYFLDQSSGWVACDGKIYETQDGGNTWKPMTTGYPDAVSRVAFKNQMEGYAFIATTRTMLKTTDGGETWVVASEFTSFLSKFSLSLDDFFIRDDHVVINYFDSKQTLTMSWASGALSQISFDSAGKIGGGCYPDPGHYCLSLDIYLSAGDGATSYPTNDFEAFPTFSAGQIACRRDNVCFVSSRSGLSLRKLSP